MLSSTEDGFQSGYRWLSDLETGPVVANILCRKAKKS